MIELSALMPSRNDRRNPTILDVAARAGVSKSVVSRVLLNSSVVSVKSREAVLRAIEELGYRPNAAARTLVRRRSNTIGVLVTDLHNPIFVEIVDGIEAVAEAQNYTVLILSGKHESRSEAAALEKLLELRVDGVVCDTAQLRKDVIQAAARSVPVVTLTRTPELPRVDSVVTDDFAGAALAVEHLAAHGHRRIAMIADAQERAGADRIEGFERAMRELGLGRGKVVPGGFTEVGGYRAAEKLLRAPGRPTAIFAANDFSAFGVLDAAAAAGLQVPDDLSVVGYDDVWFASLRPISLTTVRQPAIEIGKAAINAVFGRIERRDRSARRIVMAPSLVPRSSSGPAPTSLPR